MRLYFFMKCLNGFQTYFHVVFLNKTKTLEGKVELSNIETRSFWSKTSVLNSCFLSFFFIVVISFFISCLINLYSLASLILESPKILMIISTFAITRNFPSRKISSRTWWINYVKLLSSFLFSCLQVKSPRKAWKRY